MLRNLLRIFSKTPARTTRTGPPQVLLYAQVDRSDTDYLPPTQQGKPPRRNVVSQSTRKQGHRHVRGRVQHRAWLLSMRIEHIRICSPARCDALRKVGVVTAGDLATSDPARLAVRLGGTVKAAAVLKRYRRAVRLAASVPGMMPLDAMLLINIHRRSLRGLAIESPAALYRDLQRFAISTKGRRLLKGRKVPSIRRLKKWIQACEPVVRQARMSAAKGARPSRVAA
tara:strand:- start:36943 stop:37623 length:681 start_codon:yes stop_codon:yes gene_type:complete